MKPATAVSPDKLRGGFYTPAPLVDLCLQRVAELGLPADATVLEPSAGDGAFVDGLARAAALRARIGTVTAMEVLDLEAAKARRRLHAAVLPGEVRHDSAIAWAATTDERFDAAVGNPPYVRYQFISAADRAAADALAQRLGLTLAGVANLWIPVLLGALSRLTPGGVFAFVLPTEILTGVSAAVVRRWLLDHAAALRFDLFSPGSFPGVLQEVTVLSGRIAGAGARSGQPRVRLVDHLPDGTILDREHPITEAGPWTKYLLTPTQVQALDAATTDARTTALGDLVAFEVSIVTGANDYFTVPAATVEAYDLHPWARPLLPRIRHAPGLTYTSEDHAATQQHRNARAFLLDFGPGRPDPAAHPKPRAYLTEGERRALPARYKCRIRDPWYRVPNIRAGELLLSKRCHHFPRVVVNEAGVLTTDTIYRGRLRTATATPSAIAATFHNSLTLLTAELEGRSFGGGVLELVPSEIARLRLPDPSKATKKLVTRLDALARANDYDVMIAATDASLVAARQAEPDVLQALDTARRTLLQRRLDRNRAANGVPATPAAAEPGDAAA